MLINENVELDYDDVLLLPNRSRAASRKNVKVTRNFQFYHSPRFWSGTPIFAANMSSVGTLDMAQSLAKFNMCTAVHKFYSTDDYLGFLELYGNRYDSYLDGNRTYLGEYAWFTTGIRKEDIDKIILMGKETYDMPNIVIDVPNGYTDNFVETCCKIRELAPNSIIMAGNVCTGEMVQELILHGGVDIVKVGIGPGRNCTTRQMTGIGRPQLSAVIECASAAHNLKSDEKRLGLICADGGCSTVGSICKAYCAGADFVMLGNMFAGCEECEGEWTYSHIMEYGHPDKCSILKKYVEFRKDNPYVEGEFYSSKMPGFELIPGVPHTYHYTSNINKHGYIEKFKKSLKHYGMSSEHAQKLHYGEVKEYITPEGEITEVDYKGPVERVVKNILGGIRSCCTYIGTDDIKYMSKHARFVKVNRIK